MIKCFILHAITMDVQTESIFYCIKIELVIMNAQGREGRSEGPHYKRA